MCLGTEVTEGARISKRPVPVVEKGILCFKNVEDVRHLPTLQLLVQHCHPAFGQARHIGRRCVLDRPALPTKAMFAGRCVHGVLNAESWVYTSLITCTFPTGASPKVLDIASEHALCLPILIMAL